MESAKILAEHRAGQLIAAIPRVQGDRNGKTGLRRTLRHSGVSKDSAYRWEAISTVPIESIEILEQQKNEAREELTSEKANSGKLPELPRAPG